ncbi:MAG TPA: type II toxin-antitoxin system VapC family toxin [Planctomycetaceae bacterium]|nr:type II toxin-antitoxin system VapC family toxin [Planctomycetaceae bacterium]HQZ69685.1 type II toxin-antitoxin system VapC family toxin [Planctomycetaceae bacterium]
MDTVYIETSIVSHATSRPSSDIQIAAIQHQARTWWTMERPNFEIVTSQLVIDEASAGDPLAAADRLNLLAGLPTVPINDEVRALARAIVSASMMPAKAVADALHVAAAAVAGIQYLLTLNCKHIANAHELPRVYRLLDDHGFGQLLICTPAEFLGGDDDDKKSDS